MVRYGKSHDFEPTQNWHLEARIIFARISYCAWDIAMFATRYNCFNDHFIGA